MNVSGTSNSTSSLNEGGSDILSDIKYKENKEATAAATIPLGPIQAMKAFSRQFRSDFHELSHTTIGRKTKTTKRKIYKELSSNNFNSSKEILAERMINKTDIRITVRLSLKIQYFIEVWSLYIGQQYSITVTDNSPDSACRVSAPAKANMTKPSDRTLIRK